MLKFSNFFQLSFLCLFLTPENLASYSPCRHLRVKKASSRLLATISLQLYENQRFDDYTAVLAADAANLLDKINCSRPTVLYISGWTEKTDSQSIATVFTAYFKRRDHNVILVNYYQIARQIYASAVSRVNGVACTLAQALDTLVSRGLSPSTLRIIGHSLGAQIAGRIKKYANFEIERVTGLDPAGPGFDLIGKTLSHKDAKFVDIIHTNDGHYGSGVSKGTVDFYPNGGRFQPGCPATRTPMSDEDFCDHHRSWYYYAESLLNENAFIGLKCNSYKEFRSGLCKSNETAIMGYGTPTTARGSFYLQTNSELTYGRGENGTCYRSTDSSISSMLPSTLNPNSFGR